MKKLIFFLVLSGYLTAFSQTQSEQNRGMNFQGVAYDGSGKAMANLPLNVKITLSSKDPEPETYYAETHLTTTNELGVFNLVVGNGTQRAGEISFRQRSFIRREVSRQSMTDERFSDLTSLISVTPPSGSLTKGP